MNRYLLLIILFSTGFITGLIGISSSAEYGFKMLEIPVGAGVSGQSGAGTFSNWDASAFLENPAAVVLRSERLISVTQNSYLMDTNQNSIFYSYANGGKHFGIGLRTLDYGKIDKRDDTGQIVGTMHPLDLHLVMNYAWRLNPDHYVGFNAGLLYEKIDAASSYGTVFDVGYTYLPPLRDTKLYAAVRNIGMTSKMDKEEIKLAKRMDIGISRNYAPKGNTAFKLDYEFKSIFQTGSAWRGSVGAQASYQNMISLAMGTDVKYLMDVFSDNGYSDAPTWTAGLGFHLTHFIVDYAYTPHRLVSDEADAVHRIGLTFRF